MLIQRQKLLERWDALPDSLREAAFSEENSGFLWKIGQDAGLTDDKIKLLSRLASYVYLGFVHADDLHQEIETSLGLDAKVATGIANELAGKIFKPYKDDLKNIYSPLSGEGQSKPIMISGSATPEINKPVPVQPASMPTPLSTAPVSLKLSPLPTMPTRMPIAASPLSVSPAFTSSPLPANPKSAEPAKPTPSGFPASQPAAAFSPEIKPFAPNPASGPSQPAPFMIHAEESAKPLETASGFRLKLDEKLFASAPNSTIKSSQPPRPAQLEIGAEEKKVLPSMVRTPTNEARVVHYSDARTAMSNPMQPTANTPGSLSSEKLFATPLSAIKPEPAPSPFSPPPKEGAPSYKMPGFVAPNAIPTQAKPIPFAAPAVPPPSKPVPPPPQKPGNLVNLGSL